MRLLGNRISEIIAQGSEIRKMFLLGQKLLEQDPSKKIIDLSLGNPDLEPPEKVFSQLAIEASRRSPGLHRYMDTAGYAEVRSFLAQKLSEELGEKFSRDDVFVTLGAAGSLQVIFRTILDPGDEVVIFKPFFVEYLSYVSNYGAESVLVESDENHLPLLEDLKKKLSPKTRAILINCPNNPSGRFFSSKFNLELLEIVKQYSDKFGTAIHIISDEPYNRLVYDDDANPYFSFAKHYPLVWTVRSHSKDLGLAGERIGYFCWTPALQSAVTMDALRNAARALGFVSAPALFQRLLPFVYDERVFVDQYAKRVLDFVRILRDGGLSVAKPEGGFFVFPRAPKDDGDGFCKALINHGVLCVPGKGFGKPEYFRVSLTQPHDLVIQAANIIVAVSKSF